MCIKNKELCIQDDEFCRPRREALSHERQRLLGRSDRSHPLGRAGEDFRAEACSTARHVPDHPNGAAIKDATGAAVDHAADGAFPIEES